MQVNIEIKAARGTWVPTFNFHCGRGNQTSHEKIVRASIEDLVAKLQAETDRIASGATEEATAVAQAPQEISESAATIRETGFVKVTTHEGFGSLPEPPKEEKKAGKVEDKPVTKVEVAVEIPKLESLEPSREKKKK